MGFSQQPILSEVGMMASAYEELDFEIIEFSIEDVITSSTGCNGNEDTMTTEVCIVN